MFKDFLRYLSLVTEDLLLISILIALMLALLKMVYGRKGERFVMVGIWTGLAAATAMAYAKNRTSKIATAVWNTNIFYVAVISAVLFIVLSLIFTRRTNLQLTAAESLGAADELEGVGHKRLGIGDVLVCLTAAVLTADLLFYEAPDVIAYPFNFNLGEAGVLSVDFLLRILGWLAALILVFVMARYVFKCAMGLGSRAGLLTVLDLALLVSTFRFVGLIIAKWLNNGQKRTPVVPYIISREHPWAFPLAKFVDNNTVLFTFVVAGLALALAAALFIRNLRVTQPYDNVAQHRKLKAACARHRRWAVAVAICFVIALLSLTIAKDFVNQKVTLSAPETYTLEGDTFIIPVDQVSDGHLHRFEYQTENGIKVRWIVVRKPNSAAYGVGLDACDVCGNAGYYERNDQIVCKQCDVVMNINTIGFKGGCNPIPLAFSVESGEIHIALSDVLAGEKEFK